MIFPSNINGILRVKENGAAHISLSYSASLEALVTLGAYSGDFLGGSLVWSIV